MIALDIPPAPLKFQTTEAAEEGPLRGEATIQEFVTFALSRLGYNHYRTGTSTSPLNESPEELQRRQAFWNSIDERIARLSEKDREILDLLLQCIPNKVVAHRLQISERAVEMRRAKLMKKMQTQSLPELIRLVTKFEIFKKYGLLVETV